LPLGIRISAIYCQKLSEYVPLDIPRLGLSLDGCKAVG
jgi:hypothetical protein